MAATELRSLDRRRGTPAGERGVRRQARLAGRRRPRRGGSRGRSLEEVLVASWASLCTDGVAECPVCGEASLAVGGCEGCGSELS